MHLHNSVFLLSSMLLLSQSISLQIMCKVWTWELDDKESWAPKNWCFWTMVLEKTLESPWTARRSNQSILKEISSEYSLEGLMLKLKLQHFGHLMQRADFNLKRPWCWERLRSGGEGDYRWDGWMASLTQWTWVWVNSGSWWWPGRPGVLRFMGSQRVGHDWAAELNWQFPNLENKTWNSDNLWIVTIKEEAST